MGERLARPEVAGRRAPDALLTIAVYVSILAAVFPLLRVVKPGWWTLGVLALPAVVLGAGYVARRYRMVAVGVSLIETALWVLMVTGVFLHGTALLWVVPVPATVAEASDLVRLAMDHIVTGAAPLDAGPPLTFLIVGAVGLLTIGIDHVVLTARMPLLAAVGLIVVSLAPALAVPDEVDVPAFVMLAAALLFLLRAETRTRDAVPHHPARTPPRQGGLTAAATGIGAIAVIVAVVVAPLFPATAPATGPGSGRWNSIDPTLQLGEDLRRPTEGEVLTLTTDATSAPYLRAATLTTFDGQIWRPDTGPVAPFADEGSLGAITVDDDVRVTRYTTEVTVTNLLSGWLPVPYPAVSVNGLQGEWGVLPLNRTVASRTDAATGETYVVEADVPKPTLEKIRAADAGGTGLDDATRVLPAGTPAIIGELAAEVTAEASNDFDRLAALQTWFRSSEFQYSLDAPVQDGFDGTGVDAVAAFLEVREGYCIHFAGAFALMARSLDMSSRIVVGYLPGQSSSDTLSGERGYTVMSSQLHAWPEVHFEGIGWVPFEPTKSLGTVTTFSPAAAPAPDTGGTEVEPAPAPEVQAPPAASAGPQEADVSDPTTTDASETLIRPLPWVLSALALLLVLAVPAAVREYRRRDLLTAARGGDATAAWRSIQDIVIDLSIPEPSGETPRAFGIRLIADHGAPAEETWMLVHAIERASYSHRNARYGPDLADTVRDVRAGLFAAAPRWRRWMALTLPRSLVVRPGSAYSATGRAHA